MGTPQRTDDREKAPEALHRLQFYTASLSEKANLRKDLANWRGRDFRATGNSADSPPRTSSERRACCPDDEREGEGPRDRRHGGSQGNASALSAPVNACCLFPWSPANSTRRVRDSLSDKMQAIIKLSPEYQQLKAPAAPHSDAGGFNDFEDDIPF